jgi:hypothetical protein
LQAVFVKKKPSGVFWFKEAAVTSPGDAECRGERLMISHRKRHSSDKARNAGPTVPGMMRILGIGLTWKRLAALRKEASDLHL